MSEREAKYIIVCEKKRRVYLADDNEIWGIYKAKKKDWPWVKEKFKLDK